MFKEEYILDLLSGRLTQKGYASIVGSIASMARRYNWQKNIIVSDTISSSWTDDDVEELTQQFFEWVIVNEKLKYIDKVPHSYLAYYFTQMLISFVSNRIKEEQQKLGISFQKCQELVKEIIEENYSMTSHNDRWYVKSSLSINDLWLDDLATTMQYLPHYPITEETKHYKPIVKLAIEDILLAADAYVCVDILTKCVYDLLDQSAFANNISDDNLNEEIEDEYKYKDAIHNITDGVSRIDAEIYLSYIFSNSENASLSELAIKYSMPKSSLHKKIEDFKKKIFACYMPDNEQDGIQFLQKLAQSLDDLTK